MRPASAEILPPAGESSTEWRANANGECDCTESAKCHIVVLLSPKRAYGRISMAVQCMSKYVARKVSTYDSTAVIPNAAAPRPPKAMGTIAAPELH